MRLALSGLALFLIAGCSHDSLGTGEGADLAGSEGAPDLRGVPAGADLRVALPGPDLRSPAGPTELVVYTRTGTGVFDGTESNFQICLNASYCMTLDNAGYNELEPGQVDEFRLPASSLTPGTIDEVRLQWQSGTNGWKPTCLALVLDGELLFCDDGLTTTLGNGSGESPSYSAPDIALKKCASCWGASAITHGPMVGHTTTTTAKIWFRTAEAKAVTLELATSASFASPIVVGPVTPTADTDFMATLEATDLVADTRYYYRLLVDGQVATAATAPSFLTAPGATGKFTIAAGSCAKYEDQPIFDAIEALDPTLMLMMGDNHYGNTNDLAALRFHYRNSRKKSGVEKLFVKTPTLATWDDHDYVGNNASGSSPGKDQSLRGFKEAWANPSYGTSTTPGVFHHAEWGGVDVIMIDDRYYRDLDGSMLGAEQHAWLIDTLKNSSAAFKLIVSGSQWTSYGSNDSWASFNDEREAILQDIFDNQIGGVLLLSGDIHRSEARQLVDAGPGRYPIYELTSSGFAQIATPCVIALGGRLACYSEKNSFGLYTIDTTLADPTLKFEIRDIDGGVQYTLDLKLSDLQVP